MPESQRDEISDPLSSHWDFDQFSRRPTTEVVGYDLPSLWDSFSTALGMSPLDLTSPFDANDPHDPPKLCTWECEAPWTAAGSCRFSEAAC